MRIAGERNSDVKDTFMQVRVHPMNIQALRQKHILRKYAIRQRKVASTLIGESSRRTPLAAEPQHLSVDPERQVFTFDRRHHDPKVQRIPGLAEANGHGKRVLASALRPVGVRRGQFGGDSKADTGDERFRRPKWIMSKSSLPQAVSPTMWCNTALPRRYSGMVQTRPSRRAHRSLDLP